MHFRHRPDTKEAWRKYSQFSLNTNSLFRKKRFEINFLSGKTFQNFIILFPYSPETIGTATVHLVELLANPSLDGISVLIVFSKADLQSPRKLQELKSIIRLDQIASMSSQDVQEMTFNIKKKETLGCIFEWCVNFQTSPLDIM